VLKANIKDDTAQRVSSLTGKPLTKGFDKQVNALCDEVDTARNKDSENPTVKKVDCLCDETKEMLKTNV